MKITLNIEFDSEERQMASSALEPMYRKAMQRALEMIQRTSEDMPFSICPDHKRTVDFVVTATPVDGAKIEVNPCCDKLLRETTVKVAAEQLPQLQIEPNPLTTQLPRIDLNADEVKKIIFAFTSGDILEVPIGDKRQLRMGRRATQSGQLLDIDLQPFKAEEMGVSRMHCAIEIIDNQLHIADLGSTNGTFLNGLRIHEPRPLRNGDLLRIGNLTMTVRFSQ